GALDQRAGPDLRRSCRAPEGGPEILAIVVTDSAGACPIAHEYTAELDRRVFRDVECRDRSENREDFGAVVSRWFEDFDHFFDLLEIPSFAVLPSNRSRMLMLGSNSRREIRRRCRVVLGSGQASRANLYRVRDAIEHGVAIDHLDSVEDRRVDIRAVGEPQFE